MAKPADEIDWQAPKIVGGKGVITAPTGIEEKPCFTCKSWDKDTRKLTQFLLTRGLQPDMNGVFETPIVQDFHDGRKSMKVDPKDWGFCRRDTMPTHMMATCEGWKPTVTRADMRGKIR